MPEWINFKELREKLDFKAVLQHYGVELKLKRNGTQHHGFCPLPKHGGKKNSASFSANVEKGIFQCFGCGAKGNVLDFAALMENIDPANGTELRRVAVKLQERFCPRAANVKESNPPAAERKIEPARSPATIINSPLDFELKGLDPTHPYLLARGFSRETIAHFGLGFASRGLLKDRIAIPLRDHKGNLVGYAGRVGDDATISENNPRYRFPGKRERGGVTHEFMKTLFLYNAFRIKTPVDDLIVVEGFASAWWLHQHGYSAVVATMGADCSERQAELVVSMVNPNGRVWLLPDGDEAGERFAIGFLKQITPHRFTRWVKLETGKQPTDYRADELNRIFSKGNAE